MITLHELNFVSKITLFTGRFRSERSQIWWNSVVPSVHDGLNVFHFYTVPPRRISFAESIIVKISNIWEIPLAPFDRSLHVRPRILNNVATFAHISHNDVHNMTKTAYICRGDIELKTIHRPHMELWSVWGTLQFNAKYHKEMTNRIYGTGKAVSASGSFRGTGALMSKRFSEYD